MKKQIALKVIRVAAGPPCRVCGNVTYLTPCEKGHDSDGLKFGRMWALIANWMVRV